MSKANQIARAELAKERVGLVKEKAELVKARVALNLALETAKQECDMDAVLDLFAQRKDSTERIIDVQAKFTDWNARRMAVKGPAPNPKPTETKEQKAKAKDRQLARAMSAHNMERKDLLLALKTQADEHFVAGKTAGAEEELSAVVAWLIKVGGEPGRRIAELLEDLPHIDG